MEHSPNTHVKHTSPWLVFAVLAILTVIEVAVSLIPGWVKNPLLLAISLVKAGLVALYYMHLRYEKPILGVIFITPAIMAVLLAVILMND
jgi:cytochrome c oxidase subunit IV